jgi:hypothetical protein
LVFKLGEAMLGGVILTAAALGAFRRIRNALLAAPVAALGFTLVMLPPRLVPSLITRYICSVEGLRNFASIELSRLIWATLFLLGLAVAVRWMKPVWLALLAGSAAGTVLALAARTAIMGSELSLRWLVGAAYSLAGGLVFAGAFWGGLQLPWARLREGPEAAAPNYQRISKGFFFGSVAVAFGIALPLAIDGYVLATRHHEGALQLLALSLLPTLYLAVVMLVLFYKMWAAIQDGHARATPGKAIGFLFIPVLNIYWAFQLVWGWAKDYNRLVERHGLNAPRVPEGLFLAYVILAFASCIPVLGLVLVSVSYFIALAMVEKICDGINAIPPQLKPAA